MNNSGQLQTPANLALTKQPIVSTDGILEGLQSKFGIDEEERNPCPFLDSNLARITRRQSLH
jgi:hypothetical protein